MHAIEMSFQCIFLITGIGTYATTIGLFSSMDQDVASYLEFVFHDFATQRTLRLTILKNYGLNNLQQYSKIPNLFTFANNFFKTISFSESNSYEQT